MSNDVDLLNQLKTYIFSAAGHQSGMTIDTFDDLLAVCRRIREDSTLSDAEISRLVGLANDVFTTSYRIENRNEYNARLAWKNKLSD